MVTKDDAKDDRVYYAGNWRSPAGVEAARERVRLRQQQRRQDKNFCARCGLPAIKCQQKKGCKLKAKKVR